MKALYCLSFDKKTEWIDDGRKLVENQLGTALLTFLSTDFDVFLKDLAVDETLEQLPDTEKMAETVAAKLHPLHPFFENALLPMFFEPDKQAWLLRRLKEFQRIQGELFGMTDAVLLTNNSKLSALQRLYMLQSRDKIIATKFAALSDLMPAERRTYINGCPFEPILTPAGQIAPPTNMTSRLFVGADDLQAILLTELEEMAQQNVKLQKCAYCGGYFQPFSSRTVYCDRLVGKTGKTCKELAAKEKYEKKIAADEGLSLYQRRNKAYSMRVSRAPEIYKDVEYQAWKASAEAAVKRYVDGTLDLERLTQILEIPNAKAAHLGGLP